MMLNKLSVKHENEVLSFLQANIRTKSSAISTKKLFVDMGGSRHFNMAYLTFHNKLRASRINGNIPGYMAKQKLGWILCNEVATESERSVECMNVNITKSDEDIEPATVRSPQMFDFTYQALLSVVNHAREVLHHAEDSVKLYVNSVSQQPC